VSAEGDIMEAIGWHVSWYSKSGLQAWIKDGVIGPHPEMEK